jgi:hypothetical protein
MPSKTCVSYLRTGECGKPATHYHIGLMVVRGKWVDYTVYYCALHAEMYAEQVQLEPLCDE